MPADEAMPERKAMQEHGVPGVGIQCLGWLTMMCNDLWYQMLPDGMGAEVAKLAASAAGVQNAQCLPQVKVVNNAQRNTAQLRDVHNTSHSTCRVKTIGRIFLQILSLLFVLLLGAATPVTLAASTTVMDVGDAAALWALYEATDGHSWRSLEGWAVLNGTGTVPCNITTPQTRLSFGFTCNSRGRVVQLVLLQNGLKGSIPERFYELRHLQLLVLQGSQGLTGTLSEAVGQLTRLGRLYLDQNGLTGRIPGTMGKLASVTALVLDSNSLTGTIPPQLGGLTSMTVLELYSNSLTGTIPLQLGGLNSMTQLGLDSNSLTGTIPPQLGGLTSMTVLELGTNSLTGTIPLQLGGLTLMTVLVLNTNSLTGTIPLQLGDLTLMTVLVLNTNSLTGTIPLQLGGLTSMTVLELDTNSLTGAIPLQLANLNSMTILDLDTNSLTGTIPPQLGNLNSMTTLLLYTNSLTSTIPLQLSHLTSLKYFVVSNNHLTGTIDQAALLSQLKVLMLHGNDFTGMVPSFASHHLLQHLTLFGNRLRGQLVLPTAGNMSTLYAHNNRLSCPVVANGTTVNHDKNLVVPGNVFSKPSLPWMRMGNVGFLFAETTWNRWQGTIIGLTCGSVVSLVSLTYCWLPEAQGWSCASWTEALFKVMAFQPQGDIQHLQVWAAKVLMIWSIVGLVLLWPTFVAGAHFYQCEEGWLQGTLAYLWNSPVAEWVGAITANLLAAMWAASIRMLEGSTFSEQVVQADSHSSITWGQGLLLLALWLPATVTLSIPSSFYGLTQSLPPNENVMGIGSYLIDCSHYSIGIVVFVISGYIVPKLACKVVQYVCPNSAEVAKAQISGRLMMAARLTLVVLSPSLTVLLTNQDCFAKWLLLWTPCADPVAFNTKVRIATTATKWFELTVTAHHEICTPAYISDGRCPRALIQTLADLYIKKLAFSVYLAPVLNLLKSSAKGRAAKEWVMRTLLRKPDYQASKSLTREVVGVVMMMELPIILGFSVPVVTLLACLGTALNALVFHTAVARLGIELTNEIKASSHYLWISLAMGCALPSWMYMESNLHGRWVVTVGMPLSALCGAFAGTRLMQRSAREVQGHSLREPLMNGDGLSTERALLEAL